MPGRDPGGAARAEVLARIRAANAAAGATAVPVERAYRTAAPTSDRRATLELLRDRLRDYRAVVLDAPPGGEPAAIASVTAGQGPVVRAPGVPEAWCPGSLVDLPGEPLDVHALDRCYAVVTGCAAACAETGTIALDAGPDQGRRALSLIPDRHICVVHADAVVHTVPELVGRLDPSRPLTLISGPSATSDIELSRIEGVHGPRTLIVILVADPG
jgi:L-lactate dehydrogenase complex protein LldG